MVCDGLRWSAMVCDASESSKSQENSPFHRNVWLSLKPPTFNNYLPFIIYPHFIPLVTYLWLLQFCSSLRLKVKLLFNVIQCSFFYSLYKLPRITNKIVVNWYEKFVTYFLSPSYFLLILKLTKRFPAIDIYKHMT